MNKKIIIIQIILLVFLSSCKSVKEGLSGRKGENSDEFLVKKKTPLVLPPDFDKLPVPNSSLANNELEGASIKDIISSSTNKTVKKKSNNESIEEFIINQIKKD